MIRPALFVFSLLLATSLSAQDEATAQLETALKRMRDTLRTTTVRLQTAEAERATAQAALTESERKNKDLEAKLAALTKAAEADRAESEKQIASLVNKVGNQGEDLKRLSESLAKWKAGYEKIVTQAKAIEAQRASLAVDKTRLERLVADRERKNLELFRVGNEILTRYKKFSLGTALAARQPFTGITRVKLEGLVQDYADQLEDARIRLDEAGTSPAGGESDAGSPPVPPTKPEQGASAAVPEAKKAAGGSAGSRSQP